MQQLENKNNKNNHSLITVVIINIITTYLLRCRFGASVIRLNDIVYAYRFNRKIRVGMVIIVLPENNSITVDVKQGVDHDVAFLLNTKLYVEID